MNDTTPATTSVRPVAFLHCLTCHKIQDCKPDEMLEYTKLGWPKCCGEVMTLYSRSDGPQSRDTKFA